MTIQEPITVEDVRPGWFSYITDVENCLKPDPRVWGKYLSNPEFRFNVVLDILNDFGLPEFTQEQRLEAAKRYFGYIK